MSRQFLRVSAAYMRELSLRSFWNMETPGLLT